MIAPRSFDPSCFVLISGAAGGLGKAFAVECASRGWSLYLTDLTASALEPLAAGLRAAYGVTVRTAACDLTLPEARAALFAQLREEKARLWALINVAGIDYEGPFYEQTAGQIRTIIRLNIEATLEMTHAALAFRDPRSPFRIVNVASLAAFAPMPVKATYAASKRFLLDFSLALREEVRDLGATVTALCPAGMPTNASCIEGIEAQGWMGQITTMNTGSVAAMTIDAALRGRAVVVPGVVNQALQAATSLLPARLIAHWVGLRWKNARSARQSQRPVEVTPAVSRAE
jgi:short-subunit dehydrogenase